MKKKLAVVACIHAVTYFRPALDIVQAHVLNKKVIMRTEDLDDLEFDDPPQKVVLIRENSILPDTSWSNFLGKDKRVRPHKFLKHKSDCLALPLNVFPELSGMDVKLGDDLTEILKIKEWTKKKK